MERFDNLVALVVLVVSGLGLIFVFLHSRARLFPPSAMMQARIMVALKLICPPDGTTSDQFIRVVEKVGQIQD
jgi:hypothetical protein